MYCKDQDDGRLWIYVFMIDADLQGQGYGKAGLRQVLHYIQEVEQCDEVIIGHKPDNERAGYLYETVGFKITGEMINGEIIRAFNTSST
jgi:diamine N-acetyltransferase